MESNLPENRFKDLPLVSDVGGELSESRTKVGPGPVVPRRDFHVEKDGIKYAGVHLIVDLIGASGIDDRTLIEMTLRQCSIAAGASLLALQLHRFTPNGGISGVAILAESHISFHSWPETRYAAVDIFMCGQTQPHRAVAVLKRAFCPDRLELFEHLRGRTE